MNCVNILGSFHNTEKKNESHIINQKLPVSEMVGVTTREVMRQT